MIVHRRSLADPGHALPTLQAMAVLAMYDLDVPGTGYSVRERKDYIPLLFRDAGGKKVRGALMEGAINDMVPEDCRPTVRTFFTL